MILTSEIRDITPVALQSALDETIIRLVEEHDGIKDTALTVAALAEIADHPKMRSSGPQYAVVMVVKTIHKLIHAGRLIAVDCETPKGGFTFVLPAGTRPSIALPIYVVDNRTQH